MAAEIEFSRPFALADVGDGEAVIEIAAEAHERTALARRFGLLALDALVATVRLKRVGGGAVSVDARCVAEVVQACVVTLEPIASRIEDSCQVLFAPLGTAAHADVTVSWDEDGPEPLTGDTIDVGEVVAAHLGVALDPYPRRPDAVFSAARTEGGEDPSGASPFGVLRGLVRKS